MADTTARGWSRDAAVDETADRAADEARATDDGGAADDGGADGLGTAHRRFRARARRFVRDELLPHVATAEEEGTFPPALWPRLGAAGLLGLGHPAAHGGSGAADALGVALLAEELAGASGGLAIAPLVSAYMAAPHLARHGTAAQRARHLGALIAGTAVAALAVTEPGAGSDVAGIATTARAVAGGYVLSGTKTYITNGGIADVLIVAAKTDPAAGHRGISLFLVERGDPGFAVGPPLAKLGWHSSDTRTLTFADCALPADRLLGDAGRGFYQLVAAIQVERVALAAMGVGLARAAFDAARAHVLARHAFGRPLAAQQALRHRLADLATAIAAARLLTHDAARRLDRGDAAAEEAVAMAKLHAAGVANRAADEAVQLFGGAGFMADGAAARHYRDARVLRIAGGTDEIQREILAKRLGL